MGGCISSEKGPAVPQISFDLKASNKENASIEKALAKSSNILELISEYPGCDEYVKEVC